MTKKERGDEMPNEKDDFWDVSHLLPPKRKKADAFAPKTEAVEIEQGRERSSSRLVLGGERKIAFTHEYIPSGNPLLRRVTVTATESNYRIFHVFKNDAETFFDQKGIPVPFVPFFSYAPQYSQMNGDQRSYYFYFRERANAGEYIKTTQAYLMLYFYEIMNLPELIPPKTGVERMARVWMAYRGEFPSIDKFLTVWLMDYALIHEVACPNDALVFGLGDILALSSLKEFYLGMDEEFSSCRLDAVLALTSLYDYRRGRYASSEYGALLTEHTSAAAKLVLESLLSSDVGIVEHQTVEKSFDAYLGALCAEQYKYRISVVYCPVNGADALRVIMTAAVKYAENKVRAYLSIKSRLSVIGLPQKYKDMIDAYFAAHLTRSSKKDPSPRPEYEALYDAADIGFSEEEARRIESASWENTVRLIPDEEREELLAGKAETLPEKPSEKEMPLLSSEIAFLSCFFEKGLADARRYATAKGLLFETACEHINEYFSDTIGDIVIESDGESVYLLEDYETEVEAFIKAYADHE